MASGYSLEAWRLPGVGVHEPIVKEIQFLSASVGVRMNDAHLSSVLLSAGYSRVDEICHPQSDTETLLRLFRDDVHLASFFARSRDREYQAAGPITIAGPGIESALDFGIVLPYDTPPTVPIVDFISSTPDWEFGAGNSYLKNEGLEIVTEGPTSWETGDLEDWEATPEGSGFQAPDSLEVVEDAGNARTGDHVVRLNADIRHSGFRKKFTCEPGGRYVMEIYVKSATVGRRATAGISVSSGYTSHHTNGFIFNGYALAELGNVARNAAHNGLPGGSTSGSYQKIDIDVTVGSSQTSFWFVFQDDHHTGTDGPIYYIDDFDISGPGIGLENWEPINLTTFEQSVINVHGGTYSGHAITAGTAASADGIRQIVENVPTGQVVTWGAWIYHEEGADETFTAVAKRPDGPWFPGSTAVVVPTHTYTYVATTATIGSVFAQGAGETTPVWFDIRANSATSIEFWWDDAVAANGFPATTWGDIFLLLLAPIQARGTIDYVKTDEFTALVDAAGETWDDSVAVRINKGRTMRQVMDLARRWGIEWYVGWDGTDYQLRPFDQGNMGTDRKTGTGATGFKGQANRSGNVHQSSPAFNTGLIEGSDSTFRYLVDSPLETAYGRRESYVGQVEIKGGLAAPVGKMIDRAKREKFDSQALFRDTDDFRVHEDLLLGDSILVDQPPDLSEVAGRAWAIVTIIDGAHSEPAQHVVSVRPE